MAKWGMNFWTRREFSCTSLGAAQNATKLVAPVISPSEALPEEFGYRKGFETPLDLTSYNVI